MSNQDSASNGVAPERICPERLSPDHDHKPCTIKHTQALVVYLKPHCANHYCVQPVDSSETQPTTPPVDVEGDYAYPLAPPWIGEMLKENPIVQGGREIMEREELLPCPFCGAMPTLVRRDTTYARCDTPNCSLQGMGMWSLIGWNTRSLDASKELSAVDMLRSVRQALAEYEDDGALQIEARAIDKFFSQHSPEDKTK